MRVVCIELVPNITHVREWLMSLTMQLDGCTLERHSSPLQAHIDGVYNTYGLTLHVIERGRVT